MALPAAAAPVDRAGLRLGKAIGGRLQHQAGKALPSLPGLHARPGRACDRVPSLVVYHCVDEHSAFPGFVNPEVVKGYDDELTRRADLVITTSENLRLSRESANPHTYAVLNAADVEIFNRALDPDLSLPADLAAPAWLAGTATDAAIADMQQFFALRAELLHTPSPSMISAWCFKSMACTQSSCSWCQAPHEHGPIKWSQGSLLAL